MLKYLRVSSNVWDWKAEHLGVPCRKCSTRKELLGYDRHWNRYWLLEGSCPQAVTSDDSPASAWVYVERCQPPDGALGSRRPRQPSSEEEELPLGRLAQQAQHDDQEAQQAKRGKVEIPADQEDATSWGCYKSAEHVGKLVDYLNYRGKCSATPALHQAELHSSQMSWGCQHLQLSRVVFSVQVILQKQLFILVHRSWISVLALGRRIVYTTVFCYV